MSRAIYSSNQAIPQDLVLGNLLYYSLSDMQISETDLLNVFLRHNIPESYIRKISKADAFRRASSSEKGNPVFLNNPNGTSPIKSKVEVDEVLNDPDKIIRVIGRKLIDEDNEEVDYKSVANVVYNRKSEQVTYGITTTDPNEAHEFETICKNIVDKYNIWSVYHSKDTVRNIVKRIVDDTHPVNLMPTGLCKFVPKVHTDLLSDLKEALKDLETFGSSVDSQGNIVPGANFMEVIPVIDTDDQRSLIEKASTTEIQNELFDFTQELRTIITQKSSLSTRTTASYIAKFNGLKEKVQDYEALLGNYLGFITSQITDAIKLVTDSTEEDNENGDSEEE